MAPKEAEAARLYSIRRLCPFRGTLQVIELTTSRALSADGVNWELQVVAEQPETLWGLIHTATSQQQFFRFGVWSQSEGLVKVPINPIMDIQSMLQSCDQLLEQVKQHHTAAPFPLTDIYEYWLLDNHLQPLALIASTPNSQMTDFQELPSWKATLPQEQSFCRHQQMHDQYATPAAQLESNVRDLAGPAKSAQWFRRTDNADGIGLSGRIHEKLVTRRLPATAFPELLLQENCQHPKQQQLVSDYLDWSAALLLTLQQISDRRRDQLEQIAINRPEVVEKLWRIYPKIMNDKQMTKTRVQARLRKSLA